MRGLPLIDGGPFVRQGALMLDLRASCLRLVGMNTDIPSADLQRLLGVARTALNLSLIHI